MVCALNHCSAVLHGHWALEVTARAWPGATEPSKSLLEQACSYSTARENAAPASLIRTFRLEALLGRARQPLGWALEIRIEFLFLVNFGVSRRTGFFPGWGGCGPRRPLAFSASPGPRKPSAFSASLGSRRPWAFSAGPGPSRSRACCLPNQSF